VNRRIRHYLRRNDADICAGIGSLEKENKRVPIKACFKKNFTARGFFLAGISLTGKYHHEIVSCLTLYPSHFYNRRNVANKTSYIQFLKCLIVLLLFVSCSSVRHTIYHGGPILTMDQDFQSRENMCAVVNGETIESVQGFDTLDDCLLKKAKKINLEGNLLMPGFIESHGHLFGLGQSQLGLNLRGIKTKQAVLERIKEYASSLKKGQWLLGHGWDQSDWEGGAFSTAKELDQFLPAFVYL
jgi:hypothetical protein